MNPEIKFRTVARLQLMPLVEQYDSVSKTSHWRRSILLTAEDDTQYSLQIVGKTRECVETELEKLFASAHEAMTNPDGWYRGQAAGQPAVTVRNNWGPSEPNENRGVEIAGVKTAPVVEGEEPPRIRKHIEEVERSVLRIDADEYSINVVGTPNEMVRVGDQVWTAVGAAVVIRARDESGRIRVRRLREQEAPAVEWDKETPTLKTRAENAATAEALKKGVELQAGQVEALRQINEALKDLPNITLVNSPRPDDCPPVVLKERAIHRSYHNGAAAEIDKIMRDAEVLLEVYECTANEDFDNYFDEPPAHMASALARLHEAGLVRPHDIGPGGAKSWETTDDGAAVVASLLARMPSDVG